MIWGILYPIIFYYLISAMAFFGMTIAFGESSEIYMLKQMVSSGATIPFLFSIMKQDAYTYEVFFGKNKRLSIEQAGLLAGLIFVAMSAMGIALNNFIAMTPLVELSSGFKNANEQLFGGGMALELLASCIVVPIAEETLFRGVILRRCSNIVGDKAGVVFSALLFGVIHVNVVQFVYAAILGVILAILMQKTRRIWVPILGHAAANFMAILRVETGMLAFSYEADVAGVGFSVFMAVLGMVMLWFFLKLCDSYKNMENN